ncbi:hypothetical protein [Leptospira ilyithenensis]|uniref:Uncharacterized protein n=1 Tax=Leptospira ilyithenensis TaxID=2484901 RepID=A0A4V3JXC6_9LEPT|nr:hypothetical protein [Leptospira ilyithenensis]TGN13420.1 hypothetical protein EHS11_04085 [Leptospira ilyithenensis]
MEFFLFFIFLAISIALTGVLSYYSDLLFFSAKENYHRDEITKPWESALQSVVSLFESGGNLAIGASLFLFFSLFAWFWSLLGGIIGSPHYTSSFGNYFFHAPLLFFGFLFGFPFFKEGFGQVGFGKIIADNGRPVLSGLGLGTLAANLSIWGLYHEFFFLFVLITGILILWPLLSYWNDRKFFSISVGPEPRHTEDWGNSDYDEFEDYGNDFADTEESPPAKSSPKTNQNTDWDDFDGGLGDDAPSLDDFEDPK